MWKKILFTLRQAQGEQDEYRKNQRFSVRAEPVEARTLRGQQVIMWYILLVSIHVFSCFFLTIVVLLQTGKGADIGAVFGGSSQTIFGSSGAGNFLTKLTTATAAVFMITSLTLTYGTTRQSSQSIFDETPASAPAPATPEAAPAAPAGTSSEGQTAVTPPASEATQAAGQAAPSAPVASDPAKAEPAPPAAAPSPTPTPPESTSK